MDQQIRDKLEALGKYVPFIDYMLEIDKDKYIKFVDIRKWIIDKKRYPLSDLNKIEQSITTQYKNMIVLDDKKIPPAIMDIFCNEFKPQFVDLCSDDDEDKYANTTASSNNSSKKINGIQTSQPVNIESDDDLEFVSISYTVKPKEQFKVIPKEEKIVDIVDKQALDDTSSELLIPIDQFSKQDDSENAEPANYHEESCDSSKTLFLRCTPNLFKRRDDFEDNAIENEIKQNSNSNTVSLYSSDGETSHTVQDDKESSDEPPTTGLDENVTNSSPFESPIEDEDDSSLLTRLSKKEHKNLESTSATSSNVNKKSESHSNDDVENIQQSIDSHKQATPDDKSNKLLKTVSSIDLSSLENFNLEELLSCIIQVDETENEHLESLFLKTVLRRLRNSSGEKCNELRRHCDENITTSDRAQSENKANTIISSPPAPPQIEPMVIHNNQQPILYTNPPLLHPQEIPPIYQYPFGYPQPPTYNESLFDRIQAMTNQHKLNLNDPRIKNFLNKLKNSPLLTGTEREMAANLGNFMPLNIAQPFMRPSVIPQSPLNYQPSPLPSYVPQPPMQNFRMPTRAQTHTQNYSGTPWIQGKSITYAEYKRRKAEEKLWTDKQNEYERKLRENERKRQEDEIKRKEYERKRQEDERRRQEDEMKRKKELEDIGKRETAKTTVEIRNILLNTLQPYEGKIASMWELHKNPNDQATDKNDAESKTSDSVVNASDQEESTKTNDPVMKNTKKDKSTEVNKEHNKTHDTADKAKTSNTGERNTIDRVNRAIKGLECTFKGFDQIQDYIPKTIGGRRRSSVHARSAIAEQLTSLDDTDVSLSQSTIDSSTPPKSKRRKTTDETEKHLGMLEEGKRTSSVQARSAIAEQLIFQDDTDDIFSSQSSNESSQSYTTESTIDLLNAFTTKRRKTSAASEERKRLSSINARSAIAKQLNDQPEYDTDGSTEFLSCTSERRKTIDESNERLKEKIIQNQPSVVLVRLTEDEIRMYTKRREKSSNILNVHLIESKSLPTPDVSPKMSSNCKKALPKTLNNDCEMTERNTKSCCLCSSKSSDLTSHYLRKHKSESYVSRLTWSQLDELCINTPFAKVLPSKNGRVIRYSITCPFCDEELEEPFMNLYNHYSTHTGEYAFQCTGCQLEKPYKADIQSHQLHSKTCRGSRIQTLYLYQSNTMVIYLHYCTICNFVQINEANIMKHLRDHHDKRQCSTENVQKCILAAISDGDTQQTCNDNSDQNLPSQLPGTTNIQECRAIVSNNAESLATNELYLTNDNDIPVRNEACSEELTDSALCPAYGNEVVVKPTAASSADVATPPRFATRHVPKILKLEPIDVEDRLLLSPQKPALDKLPSNHKSSARSTYRLYSSDTNYLGLYKCMADDCFYSTDSSNEMLKHFEDHDSQKVSCGDYLQCAYCIVKVPSISAEQLVEHIRVKHQHMIYQCSICCYRSCEASNVMVHQLEFHEYNTHTCKIYKCSGTERAHNRTYLSRKLSRNVRKIQCSYCASKTFYHSTLLEKHIKDEHKSAIQGTLKFFSCIYCPLTDKKERSIRAHVAFKHPEEWPYVCNHNNTVSEADDLIQNLKPTDWSHPTSVTNTTSNINTVSNKKLIVANNDGKHSAEEVIQNLKPTDWYHPTSWTNSTSNINTVSNKKPIVANNDGKHSAEEELLKRQEESVRNRLRKLTEKTGVAPDNLYQCPEQSCGGFFSVFGLWLRHMRVKHQFSECRCPHCPSTRSLEDYKIHFEEHRRHTYICFHCPLTFGNYKDIDAHSSREHADLGFMRYEKIRFNLSYSYFVRIQNELLKNRLKFIPDLLNILNVRLKDQHTNESKNLKRSWLVSINSNWLDAYPKDICRKLKKKCFNGNCNFRSTETEDLFKHVRENHNISGSTFNCSQCDFSLPNCQRWDEVLNHIQQHSDNSFFICGLCLGYYYTRSKLAAHIREIHATNDVPIIKLFKKRRHIHLRLLIIFANECLSFSTMRDCFCCEERDMNGEAFILHLERYHKLVLNYYCEWCNLPIASRHASVEHFRTFHTRNKLKICCELASQSEVSVVSLRNLQVHITNEERKTKDPSVAINPPENGNGLINADNIVILNNDVVHENYLSLNEIECSSGTSISTGAVNKIRLLNSATETTPSPTIDKEVSRDQRVFPRIKVVPTRQLQASICDNNLVYNANSSFSHPEIAPALYTNSTNISNNQLGAVVDPLMKTSIQCPPGLASIHSHTPIVTHNPDQLADMFSSSDVLIPMEISYTIDEKFNPNGLSNYAQQVPQLQISRYNGIQHETIIPTTTNMTSLSGSPDFLNTPQETPTISNFITSTMPNNNAQY